MKRLFLLFIPVLLISGLSGCKKTVEKKAEDYILEIMTEGRWYMYQYMEQDIDLTYEFQGYEFQFHENGKVDGIRDNLVVKTGTWQGDITNYSITANFESATLPLAKLNNTWKITDSYINAVFAEATVGSAIHKMQLVKK